MKKNNQIEDITAGNAFREANPFMESEYFKQNGFGKRTNSRKVRRKKHFRITLLILCAVGLFIYLFFFTELFERTYTAEDFGIRTVHSQMDINQNGFDDYTDILRGAKEQAKLKPVYDGTYYAGGYPPENIGVCTDVVWRSFLKAGYNLKEMVDRDIARRPEAYTAITKPDPNIDFRRVKNLLVFFEAYGEKLTLDVNDIEQWQPGDIVIFRTDKHIGIVSDLRDKDGHTYILHSGGQDDREEDYLERATPTGHYRFDATKIDPSVLVMW